MQPSLVAAELMTLIFLTEDLMKEISMCRIKIEFPGLIVNLGLRGDFFNQNRNAPKNMYDPLAFRNRYSWT